jgi:putative tricarboxylic transport membrane protein
VGAFDFDFASLFSLSNLFGILVGTLVGQLIGALPGLGATVAIVMLLPFTYSMEPLAAILMLVAAYQAAEYGGSISSIVLGIPGTPAAAATTLDGFALAKQSSPGKALAFSLWSSTVGGLVGGLVLLFLSMPLSLIAVQLGDPEFFLVGILGLIAVAGLSSSDVLRSFISVTLGLMASTVGIDVISSVHRFTFGTPLLFDGLHLVAVLVGTFAIAEILGMVSTELHKSYITDRRGLSTKLSLSEMRSVSNSTWIGSVIGSVVGIMPGLGAGASSWFAYSLARRTSRTASTFGKGNPEGISAPEAANNATVGGAMLPVVTLGIPGSASTAIIMGAFIIHGVQPGPTAFSSEPQLIYGIFYGFLLSVVAMYLVGRLTTPLFARLLVIPNVYLVPAILLLALVGVYASNYLLFDLWVALLFGLLFFVFNKLNFSAPAFILAFVLSPILEESLRRALLISDGSYTMFFTRGYSLLIIGIIIAIAAFSVIGKVRSRKLDSRSV